MHIVVTLLKYTESVQFGIVIIYDFILSNNSNSFMTVELIFLTVVVFTGQITENC